WTEPPQHLRSWRVARRATKSVGWGLDSSRMEATDVESAIVGRARRRVRALNRRRRHLDPDTDARVRAGTGRPVRSVGAAARGPNPPSGGGSSRERDRPPAGYRPRLQAMDRPVPNSVRSVAAQLRAYPPSLGLPCLAEWFPHPMGQHRARRPWIG